MQHDEVVGMRVDPCEVREQALIKLRRKGIGIVRPLRRVRRLCDHRNRAVELPVAALVAEPVRMITDLLRHVDQRRRFEELLVVVLALLRQRTLEDGDRLRPCGVGVLIDEEAVALRHALEPRRILIREARRIVVHVVARSRLADDEDHRARRACSERILHVDDE